MATRRDRETTRQLLLDTGYEMLLERGLEVGWGIRLSEVTERVGLTTGAAYQIWNGSRAQHGAGGQDRFHHDLALYAMERLLSETLVSHTETYEALAGTGASLDRQVQQVLDNDYRVISRRSEAAVFAALISAATSDPELTEAGATTYRHVTERFVQAFHQVFEQYGLELVAPYTLEDLVVSIIALGDGLVMRALVDPDAVPAEHAPPADASDDARGSWHLFALGTRALIREMTRPRSS